MFELAYTYLLAASMIMSPEPVEFQKTHFGLIPAITAVSLDLELIDPKEAPWLLAIGDNAPDSFKWGLARSRERWADLKDAPRVSEGWVFPPQNDLAERMSFNRRYREHIDIQIYVKPHKADEFREILVEVDRLYYILDDACETQFSYFYVNAKRAALKRLKEKIGPAMFYAGELPPAVPVWRFQRIE